MATMWTAERWREIERMFEAATAVLPGERLAWLSAHCEDDWLRGQVERMLLADAQEQSLLDGVAIAASALDPHVGATYGAWRLEARIAEGGVGTVYRAFRVDGAFSRPVAVKVLNVGLVSAAMRERFLREPHLLGRLEHPHIARLLDGGATPEGLPYLVMELVDGRPIDRYCDDQRLDLRARLALFVKVCGAVDHAHRALVVHRDLKPSNVLVTAEGEPRLVDFGVAELLADNAEASRAPSAYTPEYASPEQIRGAPVGIAGDVWSLGVVLHELLTGRRPYAAQQVRDLADHPTRALPRRPASAEFAAAAADASARAAARASRPAVLVRTLSGDLDAIVAAALVVDPQRRYANCREFAADIGRYLAGHPTQARPGGMLWHLWKFARRNAVACVLAACLVASAIVGTGVSVHMARVARRGWTAAEIARATAETARAAAEEQARHAEIEALSGSWIATSLTDVFLNERFFADAAGLERARDRLLEEVAMLRRRIADDAHMRANVLDALGQAAGRIGIGDVAEALVREVLEIRTATFGADHLERALSLTSLGTLLYQRGAASESRDTFAEALRIHQLHPGAVHADEARAMNDLAAATVACGDYPRAIELHSAALALRLAANPHSTTVAESQNNLAGALLRVGRVDEARPLLDSAIALRRELLGDGAMLTLQGIANRGVLALRSGAADAALRDLTEAAAGLRTLRSAGSEGLAAALPKLAQAAIALDDLTTAAAAIDEAANVVRQIYGEQHPRVADVEEQRARLAARRGDPLAAVAAWVETLRLRRVTLPADHPTIASVLHNLGLARADAADFDGALIDLAASRDLRAADGARDAAVQYAIGNVLIRAGRHAEAEAPLLIARANLPEGPGDLRTMVLRGLAIVYRATDREAEAVRIEAESR